MKSSLLALIVVSSLVLSGCFKNSSHDGCSSCSDDVASEQVHCAACPTDMIAPEEVVVVEENTPESVELEEMIVEEK